MSYARHLHAKHQHLPSKVPSSLQLGGEILPDRIRPHNRLRPRRNVCSLHNCKPTYVHLGSSNGLRNSVSCQLPTRPAHLHHWLHRWMQYWLVGIDSIFNLSFQFVNERYCMDKTSDSTCPQFCPTVCDPLTSITCDGGVDSQGCLKPQICIPRPPPSTVASTSCDGSQEVTPHCICS